MPTLQTELPAPGPSEQSLSRTLQKQLCREIAVAGGSIGFDEYMEQVLYAPGLGYYSAGQRKFGAGGDFITAPEIGALFAECLAARLAPYLQQFQAPCLLELGPGSGALMTNLLPALRKRGVTLDHYWLLERSAECRRQQQAALATVADKLQASVSWLDRPPSEAFDGVVLGNEVLDALPAKCFRLDQEALWERRVGIKDNALAWLDTPADEALSQALEQRWQQTQPPPGRFTGEILWHLEAWLASVTESLREGAVLLLDYGYPRSVLYGPAHADGTVVCHYRHRVHHDPFWWPGVQDVSTFVDFTAVAEAGQACGFDLAGYTTQAGMLITACPGWLEQQLQAADDRQRYAMAAEFRRLTAPEEMGEKFQVIALTRGQPLPTRDWLPDWRCRL